MHPRTANATIAALTSAACVILILSSLSIPRLLAASPPSTPDTGCSTQLRTADSGVSISASKAESTARSSSQFENSSKGFASVWFSTTDDQWSFTRDCSVTLSGVNAIFGLNSSSGLEKWLVLDETANLSKVTRAYVAPVGKISTTGTVWSGYQLWGNANNSTGVFESGINFTQPKPIYPTECDNSGSTCICGNYGTCEVAVWAGLSDTKDATSDKLAQDGTDALIQCQNGCVYSYGGIYDLLPSNWTPCDPSGGISAGNNVEAVTYDEAGSKGIAYIDYYDFTISDISTLQACTKTGLSYAMSPSIAEQEFEWPTDCNQSGSCSSFADYASVIANGFTWYNNGVVNDYTVYNLGYYQQDSIVLTCPYWGTTTDAYPTSMNSASQWGEYYVTSACT